MPLPRRAVDISVDGRKVAVPQGSTILDALVAAHIDTPTLCFVSTLRPANACRVCVVELAGSRPLVPSCSREVTDGMEVLTDSARVRHSRKMVLEFLGSSVDLSLTDSGRWSDAYAADVARYGPPAPPTQRDDGAGHHHAPDGATAATVDQPVKAHDDLYVRDYGKCILCYKCVDVCGEQAQNSFAISAAGRGFAARISTEFDTLLTESACVYCGNCIGVCPTGALMFRSEFDMRAAGTWDAAAQTITTTICPYCGVGCNLELHVQENTIVKVTSPLDHPVTNGNLCIKGRFGFQHVQN